MFSQDKSFEKPESSPKVSENSLEALEGLFDLLTSPVLDTEEEKAATKKDEGDKKLEEKKETKIQNKQHKINQKQQQVTKTEKTTTKSTKINAANYFLEKQINQLDTNENSLEALEGLFNLLTSPLLDTEEEKAATKKDEGDKKLEEKKETKIQNKQHKINQKQQQVIKKEKTTTGLTKINTANYFLEKQINQLDDKLNKLEKKIYDPAETINILLPLMTELLLPNSNEALKQSLIPIIDEIIKQGSQQDRDRMSKAISDILPGAITQEIENSPEEIAKAIAPEIALAIKNQIELDQEAIAQTLGPEMGQAIKTQIEVERDAIVDALYPVIGNTISKYMVELAKSINDKVEKALSVEGINRKIKAKLQGISEAELILQESIDFSVEAVLLIHKSSGLIISQVKSIPHVLPEADLFAGMLTAIRDFVNDCVAVEGQVSELHEIEYDDAKIILEVAGYCYLAVIIKGEPSKVFIEKIRKTLSHIILKSGRTLKEFQGEQTSIPQFIKPKLEQLIEFTIQSKKSKPPITLMTILLLIFIACSIIFYRGKVRNYWEKETLNALDASPELSVYRLIPKIKKGQLILTGRVPNPSLKEQAGKISHQIAPHLTLNNQIISVNIPPDASVIAGEIKRVTQLLNQTEGVDIKTHYQDHTVTITGFVLNLSQTDEVSQAFQQIPGVDKVISTFQTQPHLETRIYFDSNSSQFKGDDIPPKIKTIQKFLAEHPHIHLIIIGHSDPRGSVAQNKILAEARAKAVERVLLQNKVDSRRLKVAISLESPPGVMNNQPLWLSRCVRFEVSIPPN